MVICSGSCDEAAPEDNPEIIGDRSWYDKNSPEQGQYLLNTLRDKGDISSSMNWPPDHFRRVIDISVDVTGSGFDRESLYQGRRMPLAEYNVRRLMDEFLINELKPGDKIVMRIFGAMPGGDNINVDEKTAIEFPPDKIEMDVKHPSRKPGQVQIIVRNIVHADSNARKQVSEEILNWFLGFIRRAGQRNGRFKASPLLQFIRNVCTQKISAKDNPKLLIFVTDGQFDIGDLYYAPNTYKQKSHTIDKIKTLITDSHFKPFTEPDNKIRVILFGLYSDQDEGFKQSQEEIFQWYFAPQPVEIIANQ
jgi:hypothetical protein